MKSSHSLFHSFLFGVLLWLVSPLLWAANLSVVFISPGAENEPYWRSVTRFMQPAARQLGIELEVIYCNRDQIKLTDAMHQLTLRAKKPDYVIISNDRAAAGPMLRMADEAKIKTMLAFSGLVPEQVQEFGLPRQKFPSWIGTISPNSSDGGRLTAEELVRQMQKAQLVSSDGKMHVALIAGDKFTPTGVQRQAGAMRAFEANSWVVVEQAVYGNWDRERAKLQADFLLQRYPNLNAIWVASDLMAYGAMAAAEAAGRKPGKDILISAFNNSPEVLRNVVEGKIAALAGGHFTAGAWALVMLHDYHNGIDFAKQGLVQELPLFSLLNDKMAQRFLQRFGEEDFSSIDFRQFSRHFNPKLTRYDFGLLQVLK
jgi:ABC-type sugar transport system substrate-binding protein